MKKITPYLYLVILLGSTFTLSSCLKDTDAQKRKDEQNQIQNYITTHSITPTRITADGLYYIETVAGHDDSITSSNDYAYILYHGWYLDGTLIDASDTTEARAAGVQPWQAIGGPLKLSMRSSFYGLVEGVSLMKNGGKATLIMPSLLAFNDYRPVLYRIDSLKIVHDIRGYELGILGDSVLNNGKRIIDTTKYGAYVFRTNTDTVGHPVTGDSVTVNYTSSILDGRVFQKYSTLKYRVGNFNLGGILIPGFDDAVMQMLPGAKAKVFIPYYEAFGTLSTVSSYTGQIIIPAYSTIRFDIELVSIKK